MKLQPASKQEVKRIAIGTLAFDVILIGALFLLSQFGIGTFSYRVFTGVAGGTVVAILNFAIMCLTIQKATNLTDDQKTMKAFIQGSYNGRLLLQAGWIVVAMVVSHIHVIAAAAPLLFPTMTIFYLQSKGKLVTPSDRTAPSDLDEDEPEDRLESFEI